MILFAIRCCKMASISLYAYCTLLVNSSIDSYSNRLLTGHIKVFLTSFTVVTTKVQRAITSVSLVSDTTCTSISTWCLGVTNIYSNLTVLPCKYGIISRNNEAYKNNSVIQISKEHKLTKGEGMISNEFGLTYFHKIKVC